MTGDGEEAYELLAEHRLGRLGPEVKLDKGFADGVYCVYVEFEDLAARVGFTAAHRQAAEYSSLLKAQLAHHSQHSIGDIEDPSYTRDPRRKRDLELTYLAFPILTSDGLRHDKGVKDEFQLAMLRAGQQWDQAQAREDTRRHTSRRDAFRERLVTLLAGDAYTQVDEAVKQRLLDEVPGLAFPPRGLAR